MSPDYITGLIPVVIRTVSAPNPTDMADTDPDQLDSGQRSGPVGLVELDPRVALRPGRVDPFALWTVYLLRKSFLPLLFLSAIVLSLSGREGETLDDVDTPGEFLSAVESPLVVLVIAITARLLATVLAFALAYPLSHRASMVITTHQGKRAA